MPAREIHNIDLAVRDVERSVAFYLGLLGALGLEEAARFEATAAPTTSRTS